MRQRPTSTRVPTATYWRPSGAMNTRTPPLPTALSSVTVSGGFCTAFGSSSDGADVQNGRIASPARIIVSGSWIRGAFGCLDSAVGPPLATGAFDILGALGARQASAHDNNGPEGTNP